MTHFDIFNGDADGIGALLQLRLAAPIDAVLVTGAKRDVALLDRVAGESGDSATVLDISLAVNRAALLRLLDRGVTIQYFDHHYAGEIPVHPALEAHIDPDASVCTGILVDRHLGGRHRVWAVVAAFGDNLAAAARGLASSLALAAHEVAALRDLGDCLTYNAYGVDVDDAIVHPAELFRTLLRQADPFRFMATDAGVRGHRRRRGAATSTSRGGRVPRTRCPVRACTCCRTRRGRGACAASSATSWPTPSPGWPTRC